MIDGISHYHTPQQVFRKDLILIFHMDQITGQTDHARFPQRFRL